MEEWAQKFGWKKVAIVLIIAAILGLIYVIFSMIEVNKPQVDSSNTPTAGGQNVNSGLGINDKENSTSGNSSPSAEKITNYKASQFSISYPQAYTKSEVSNPATKDDIVTLKGPQNVTMQFHFYPPSTPANAIIGPFQSLGFNEDDFGFNNFSGKIFTGKVGPNRNHQEQMVVFTGENRSGEGVLFSAFLDYLSPTRNFDIEQNFQDIVKTFNF